MTAKERRAYEWACDQCGVDPELKSTEDRRDLFIFMMDDYPEQRPFKEILTNEEMEAVKLDESTDDNDIMFDIDGKELIDVKKVAEKILKTPEDFAKMFDFTRYGEFHDEDIEEDLSSEAEYDEAHRDEWMELHPHGWYNNEQDYGYEDGDKMIQVGRAKDACATDEKEKKMRRPDEEMAYVWACDQCGASRKLESEEDRKKLFLFLLDDYANGKLDEMLTDAELKAVQPDESTKEEDIARDVDETTCADVNKIVREVYKSPKDFASSIDFSWYRDEHEDELEDYFYDELMDEPEAEQWDYDEDAYEDHRYGLDSAPLKALVRKAYEACLSKELKHRFPSVEDVIHELEHAFGESEEVKDLMEMSNASDSAHQYAIVEEMLYGYGKPFYTYNQQDELVLAEGDEGWLGREHDAYEAMAKDEPEHLTWEQLKEKIAEHNKEAREKAGGFLGQYGDPDPLHCVVVFSEANAENGNWKPGDYPLESRSYEFRSDEKYFLPDMGGNSIFASSLDGSDSIRMDKYLFWDIDHCYIK